MPEARPCLPNDNLMIELSVTHVGSMTVVLPGGCLYLAVILQIQAFRSGVGGKV